MKALNYIFCGLFICFAALQYNDPDPYIWIPIYLNSAVLCFFAARGRFITTGYLITITVYLLYAVFLLFDKSGVISWITKHDADNIASSMKASSPWIEETREFFGLLVQISILSLDLFYAKKPAHSPGKS